MRNKKIKIIISIIIIFGCLLYCLWMLHSSVSDIEQKLITVDSIAQYAKHISSYYYIAAAIFFGCGLLLGLAIGAYKVISEQEKCIKKHGKFPIK